MSNTDTARKNGAADANAGRGPTDHSNSHHAVREAYNAGYNQAKNNN